MSCNCLSLCDHRYTSKDLFTSINFGVFLFSFAMFMVFTPLTYLSTGVSTMTDAANTMGDAFVLAADAVNGQVASFVGSQVAVAESFGSGLAYVGNMYGEGASMLVSHPAAFGASLALNAKTVALLVEPRPVNQYEWSKSHRFWNGKYREVMAMKTEAAAAAQVATATQ